MVLAVALTAAAGCSGSGGDDSAEGDATPSTTVVEDPVFVERDCWWELPAETPADVFVSCGTVEVPENRHDADGATVSLPVVRLHHSGADPDAEPVVMLHGGPGGDLLGGPPLNTMASEVLRTRDIILWDQRGAGRSVPSLNCPEKEIAAADALGAAAPFEDELRANLDATRECRERLVAEGVDLDQYNTPASVADLDAIRRSLGADQINLNGTSYGSRLALAYAREYPDRVRAMVIDSVYPTESGGADRFRDAPQAAIDRLIADCADDPDCARKYPDLGATFEAAVSSLDDDPEVAVENVEVAGESSSRTFTLTGAELRSGIFAALYETELIPLIPGILTALAGGDRSILPTFIQMAMPRVVGLSEGAYYSVDCADSGRLLEDATAEELAGDGDDALYVFISSQVHCDDWDVTAVDESFNETVTVDVPTLVFGGTLDPVTPYQDSVAQADAMPDARFIGVPRGGHGVQRFDDCTTAAYVGFIQDPSAPLPDCVAAIEPLPYT